MTNVQFNIHTCNKEYLFKHVIKNINLPKVCGLRNQAWPMFCLIFKQVIKNIYLPKVYGSWNQA